MKVSEIAAKQGWDESEFEDFLLRRYDIKTSGMFSTNVADEDVEKAINLFKQKKQSEKEQKDQAKAKAEQALKLAEESKQKEKEKAEALPKMLISSGFNFEGYRIVKYSGYISGDDAVQIPRSGIFGSDNGKKLTDALVKIRIQAIKELKEAAYELGCNAVVGVDFDYITLEPETASLTGGTLYEPYIICVTANGNAVIIEKEE